MHKHQMLGSKVTCLPPTMKLDIGIHVGAVVKKTSKEKIELSLSLLRKKSLGTTVGTVDKIEDDEDNGLFSVVSALNLGRYKDHKCIARSQGVPAQTMPGGKAIKGRI
ncbi:hypothetical protein NC653_004869 [Populus alba x Populus x berolinensis]|uniref:Uncharacterized protein n=1 Tax=Populus alba x Populus x berolinensis TaxID=444605 RepID=A0AAD6WKN3_9ROSI|nr:hypothetical protein NC653_004869 [Populus alba x Populus x berolinensis]